MSLQSMTSPFRHTLTTDLLQDQEYFQFALAEIDANLGEWHFQWESRQFIVFMLECVNAEINRRKRLIGRPHAPQWPRRDYSNMKDELAAIKNNLDLVHYVEQHANVNLIPRGRDFWCSCPLPGHDDHTASFHINPAKQVFYCFGCRRGGDLFEFARQFYGLSEFARVVDRLRADAGMKEDTIELSGFAIRNPDGSLVPLRTRAHVDPIDPLRPSSYSS